MYVMKQHKCPICRGSGVAPVGWRDNGEAAAKKLAAVALRKEGYSWREIADFCGWKSRRSAVVAVLGKSGRAPGPK